MSIGKFLRDKRANAALTQLEVGRRLGFHKSQFISSMERGTSRPPIQVLKRMCAIYRISEEEMKQAYLSSAVRAAEARALAEWDKAGCEP